jgi:rare lipoprotein A (peptidoglycan hydrolase)
MRRLIGVVAVLIGLLVPTAVQAKQVSPGCNTKACAKRVCKAKCRQRLAIKRFASAPYRTTTASWYGPGLYGNPLGCGGRLYPGTEGVAHKGLGCGTRIEICASRCALTRVIDRGPYVAGREFDITEALKNRIGFSGVGRVKVRVR